MFGCYYGRLRNYADYILFNDPPTTKINTYGHTLSLHAASPISSFAAIVVVVAATDDETRGDHEGESGKQDKQARSHRLVFSFAMWTGKQIGRATRLNSSH